MNATGAVAPRGRRDYVVGLVLLIIHVGALGVFLPALFSWQAVALAVVLYWLTGFGITLGYHRLLTHRSLALPKPLEYLVATLGALAFQGGPLEWISTHRAHHANSDSDGDPHDSQRGMPWAHVEWLFRRNKDRVPPAERIRWSPDLFKEPFYPLLERLHFPLQIALAVGLYFIGGWSFVVWAVFARLVFTYHCTWLVNSASHAVGYRSFRSNDRSTNNWWVAIISFGEGWHNNHHAFPFSARHGLKWFEIDVTYWMIRALGWLRIARNVRTPSAEMMRRLELPKPPRKFQQAA